jgi:hypothetical protein
MHATKTSLSLAVLLALGSASANAITTTGNNLTLLSNSGALQGGTNDVTFTWDGTYRTSVVTDGSSNATLSSPTSLFGLGWTTHNMNIYGAGDYTFYTGCPAGNPACTTASTSKRYELTVPVGYFGAHMLVDWSTSTNIDIIQLWTSNTSWDATGSADPFCAAPLTGGSCDTNPNPNGNTRYTIWDAVSVDTPASTIRLSDGSMPCATCQPNEENLYHGTKLVDGPFTGTSVNFNLSIQSLSDPTVPPSDPTVPPSDPTVPPSDPTVPPSSTLVPLPASLWLFGSGLAGLLVAVRRKSRS